MHPEDEDKTIRYLAYTALLIGALLIGFGAFADAHYTQSGFLGFGGEAVGGGAIAYLVYENKKRLDSVVRKIDELKERIIHLEADNKV